MAEPARNTDWAISGLAQLFDAVLTAAGQSRDLSDSDRDQFGETGAAAFSAGLSLSRMIDSYLGGAGELWEQVFADADPARTVELGRSLRRVSEQAVSSLAEGFETAQRASIRAEESLRREFLDDLLSADPDAIQLAQTAGDLDFPGFDHAVVAVADAQRPLSDAGPVHNRVRIELESRAPQRSLRIATKNGLIVIIALDTTPGDLTALVAPTFAAVSDQEWRIGVGTSRNGLAEIGISYRHALDALRIGRTFDLVSPTVFDRIPAQRLLAADPEVVEALIRDVLGPLSGKPRRELMKTLDSFIRHGGNMAEVARDLHIGARTVAYRLDRIGELTGHVPRDPEGRFVLELAYRALPLAPTQPAHRDQ